MCFPPIPGQIPFLDPIFDPNCFSLGCGLWIGQLANLWRTCGDIQATFASVSIVLIDLVIIWRVARISVR